MFCKRPDISIILLTWNRAPLLKICLEKMFASLRQVSEGGPVREILIMDNGSTDETSEVLSMYEKCPNVKIIRNTKNYGLNAYKKLFFKARGEVVIEVDDDIIDFPKQFDEIIAKYLDVFSDFGFLALNVVQNEKTNGAKAGPEAYQDVCREKMIVQEGPTGGWCSGLRRKHCLLLKFVFLFINMNFKIPEDAYIASLFMRLKMRMGLIKNHKCLHACGPVYAKEFGLIKREIEKYKKSNVVNLVEKNEAFLDD